MPAPGKGELRARALVQPTKQLSTKEERQVDGSRIESGGSFDLHHMELTVDYKEGDDTPKEDHVQGVEGNRLRFMFNLTPKQSSHAVTRRVLHVLAALE